MDLYSLHHLVLPQPYSWSTFYISGSFLCFSLATHMNDGQVTPHLPDSFFCIEMWVSLSLSLSGSLTFTFTYTQTLIKVKGSSVKVEQCCPILLVMDEVMGLVHLAPLYHVFPASHSTSNKLLLISIPFILCSRC